MRRAYALPEHVDPYDNPLDRARGSIRNFCPQCGEAERERFLFHLLDKILLPEWRVLHAAAGVFSQRNLRARCHYVSSSFGSSPLAMRKEDLCALSFQDGTLDLVICFHVLEHIPDDHAALLEILRVLKPGGAAVLCVPMVPDKATREDLTLHREDRAKQFGHPDHFRIYGADFADRVRRAGFSVTEQQPRKDVPELDFSRLGLIESDRIFICYR